MTFSLKRCAFKDNTNKELLKNKDINNINNSFCENYFCSMKDECSISTTTNIKEILKYNNLEDLLYFKLVSYLNNITPIFKTKIINRKNIIKTIKNNNFEGFCNELIQNKSESIYKGRLLLIFNKLKGRYIDEE